MKKVLFLVALISVFAVAAMVTSCSKDSKEDTVTWELTDGGVLTISGTAVIPDYNDESSALWYPQKNAVEIVDITEGVTGIGRAAFHTFRNLNFVVIPASVTKIGAYAFSYSTNLGEVLVSWSDPSSVVLGAGVFFHIPSGAILYVPAGTGELYEVADQWRNFVIREYAGIESFCPSYPKSDNFVYLCFRAH